MVQLAVQVACGGGHAPGGPFEGTGPFWTRDGHTGHGRKKREATTPLPVVEKNEKDFLAHIGLGGEEWNNGDPSCTQGWTAYRLQG